MKQNKLEVILETENPRGLFVYYLMKLKGLQSYIFIWGLCIQLYLRNFVWQSITDQLCCITRLTVISRISDLPIQLELRPQLFFFKLLFPFGTMWKKTSALRYKQSSCLDPLLFGLGYPLHEILCLGKFRKWYAYHEKAVIGNISFKSEISPINIFSKIKFKGIHNTFI